MSIAPGVRLTHASIIDDTTVSPWVVVGWRGGPGLRARVAAAIQHQAPDVAQVFGSGGNPALVAARSRSFEASIGRGWDRWQWDIGVFNRQDRDYLRQIGTETRRSGAFILPGNPLGQWENALHGSTYGVEATLSRHVAQGWGGWLAYSYGKNTYTDPSRGEQFPGDFDQRHAVVMYTFYQLSARTRASARVRLGSNFPIPGYLERAGGGTLRVSDVRNRVRLPEYARLDLNVSRAFFWSNRRLTLFAEVLNATDRANYRASNNGTIRTRTGEALGFLEQLFPLLPGVGLLIEF
jgi:outer membrane cobalamin receptor